MSAVVRRGSIRYRLRSAQLWSGSFTAALASEPLRHACSRHRPVPGGGTREVLDSSIISKPLRHLLCYHTSGVWAARCRGTHIKWDCSSRRGQPVRNSPPRLTTTGPLHFIGLPTRGISNCSRRSSNLGGGRVAGKSRSGDDCSDKESLILRMLGPRWSPYARLARIDKPAAALMLAFPCWWGVALATPMHTLPDPWLLFLFGSSAFVMRSAGCTINDMLDRDLDRKVTRTKGRPLASGELGTMQALGFLTGQLSLGLCGLLSLNVECVKQGLAIMPVVMIYPLMKRYTNWPQLVLGLAFNWGAIVGWTAVHGSVSWSHVIPLYGAGICWTIVYDTLYGHQDKKDDERLGIRSTAVLFGQHTKVVLAGFGLASVTLLGVTGYAAELSWPFYVGTLISGGHLARLVAFTDLDNPDDVFRSFKSNKEFGALVLASIVAGHW